MATKQDCISKHGDMFAAELEEAENVQALRGMLDENQLRKRQAAMQVIALDDLTKRINAHSRGKAAGLGAILGKDLYGDGVGVSLNVDFQSKTIMGRYSAMFADGMKRMAPRIKNAFKSDGEFAEKVVRSLFGEKGLGEEVDAIAKQFSETAELARLEFNRAGGNIQKREDWNLPQAHDRVMVSRAGKQNWIYETEKLLDRQKMEAQLGRTLNDDEFKEMLEYSYNTIVTDGLNSLEPGKFTGAGKVSNRHQESRFLIFRDADAWLEYQKKYGPPDIYSTMVNHLQMMAHDTALLQVMGPNPKLSFRHLHDMVKKDAGPDYGGEYLEGFWRTVSGESESSTNIRAAEWGGTVRNFLVAGQLGSAFLSAMSDVVFKKITQRFNGLLSQKGGISHQMMMTLGGAEADREFATRLWLGAELWQNTLMNRHADAGYSRAMSWFSNATMRASLLAGWTDAGRKTFGMEYMSNLAVYRSYSWEDMAKAKPQEGGGIYEAMRRYGITEEEWDLWRSMEPENYKGLNYMMPEKVYGIEGLTTAQKNELASKFMNMVLTETDFAIPTPDARVRTLSSWGGHKAGTAAGETARAVMQYKSFPIGVFMQSFYRIMYQRGAMNPVSYAASLFIFTTMMGFVAMQAKDLARGKEPRKITEDNFAGMLMAAMAQGGGLGILGDFFLQDTSRFGQNLTTTLAGPTAGLISDVHSAFVGKTHAEMGGRDSNFQRGLVNLAERYTPGSSIWYLRLQLEREIFDQLELLADDRAAKASWKRTERKMKTQYDQGYLMRKPGQSVLFGD